MKKVFTYILLIFMSLSLSGQNGMKELAFSPKKLKLVIGTEAVGYTGSMVGLYQLWYSDYPMSGFHFFNDNNGWQAIDKFGHAQSSYTIGFLGMETLKWTGVERKKAIWYGGTLGLFFLTSVEVFDGFSDGWGASPGDLLANTFGSALLIGQESLWQEQRIHPKFSYSHSKYQQYNPDVLGHSFQERLLKDYNGHTYWYSFNIKSLTCSESRFPSWLNVAFGYGADGMISGYGNPDEIDGRAIPAFTPYRQYYISLDADFTRIKTSSKLLNTMLTAFSFVKIPMPTLEYNEMDNFRFYWLFF